MLLKICGKPLTVWPMRANTSRRKMNDNTTIFVKGF